MTKNCYGAKDLGCPYGSLCPGKADGRIVSSTFLKNKEDYLKFLNECSDTDVIWIGKEPDIKYHELNSCTLANLSNKQKIELHDKIKNLKGRDLVNIIQDLKVI
jgi:hypothetical protein